MLRASRHPHSRSQLSAICHPRPTPFRPLTELSFKALPSPGAPFARAIGPSVFAASCPRLAVIDRCATRRLYGQ